MRASKTAHTLGEGEYKPLIHDIVCVVVVVHVSRMSCSCVSVCVIFIQFYVCGVCVCMYVRWIPTLCSVF